MINLTNILNKQKAELIKQKKQYPELTAKQLSLLTCKEFFAFLADHYGWQETLTINVTYTIYVKGSIPEHSDGQMIFINVTGWTKEEIDNYVNEVRLGYNNKMYSNVTVESFVMREPIDACYNSEEAEYYHNWLNNLVL